MKIDIYEEIKDAKIIAIGGHINPDGDCIGSALGLYAYLRKRCPEKEITVYLQKPAPSFASCPLIGEIHSDFAGEEERKPDVFILLDTVTERLGDALPIFEKAEKTINIDHHISNLNGCGDVNYIVPDASATAELICDVMDWHYMDAEIASLLYLGIAHDTGVFRFSCTSPKTLRLAADLIAYGFDFPKLLDDTFYAKTYKQNRMQSHIVLESKLYFDGQLIISGIDLDTMQLYNASREDFDGAVNRLRNTTGVECAVFLYEKSEKMYKVSLRASSDRIDVSKVAMAFGGGGHVRAAGCDVPGTKEEIMARLIAEIGKQFI